MGDFYLITGSVAVIGLLMYFWDRQEKRRLEDWKRRDRATQVRLRDLM